MPRRIYREEPPIPGRVVDVDGGLIFTRDDVFADQGVFQKFGLMEYGSLFGHGAILGPDFTSEYLHWQAEDMRRFYAGGGRGEELAVPRDRVAREPLLAQTLVDGVIAHYRAEPMRTFYGLNLSEYLPYNLTRTWHPQLAISWVATAYLGAGVFVAPLMSGSEPRRQKALAYILLGALVVALGSLVGKAASVRNLLGDLWFWIGAQGWEYLDLGRVWQALLTIGLLSWALIVYRGSGPKLRGESIGNMPYLYFYASLVIPVFFAVGLLADPNSGLAVVEFWRFWVVRLWVEDFFELFTTANVAYAFLLLGIVSERVATQVICLSIILYSVGGVIGTLHHLYSSASPAQFIALGAFFSVMEVIPLMILTFEAWSLLQPYVRPEPPDPRPRMGTLARRCLSWWEERCRLSILHSRRCAIPSRWP